MGKRKRGRGEGGIEQLPSKAWRAILTRRDPVTGKRIRASKAFADKAAALEWLRKQQDARQPPSSRTLGDWLDVYLEGYRIRHSPGSVRITQFAVRRYIRPYLGNTPLRDMTPLLIERWLVRLEADGMSRNTLNVAGKALRAILNGAMRADLLPSNPFSRVRIPSQPKPATKSFTEEELARLIAAADGKGGYLGTMLRVWAELGCRPGELTGLRWEDFDTRAGTVWIRRTVETGTRSYREPKTPRVRPVPLSLETRTRLETHRRGRVEGVMFGTPLEDKPWWRGNFRGTVWVPLCQAAGVTGSANTMRHTCATLLLRSGVSLRAVAERLGHSDPAMTLRKYAHALPDDQHIAAGAWGKILGQTVSPRLSPRKGEKTGKSKVKRRS